MAAEEIRKDGVERKPRMESQVEIEIFDNEQRLKGVAGMIATAEHEKS